MCPDETKTRAYDLTYPTVFPVSGLATLSHSHLDIITNRLPYIPCDRTRLRYKKSGGKKENTGKETKVINLRKVVEKLSKEYF